jgi:hypothetical protein
MPAAVEGVCPLPHRPRHKHRKQRPRPSVAQRIRERCDCDDDQKDWRWQCMRYGKASDQAGGESCEQVVRDDKSRAPVPVEERTCERRQEEAGKNREECSDPGKLWRLVSPQHEEDEDEQPHRPADTAEQQPRVQACKARYAQKCAVAWSSVAQAAIRPRLWCGRFAPARQAAESSLALPSPPSRAPCPDSCLSPMQASVPAARGCLRR